jgi:FkbM family methyltransferase
MRDRIRALAGRSRLVRGAARRYRRAVGRRTRSPARPAPPKPRQPPSIELRLPAPPDGRRLGPESVTVTAAGNHTLFKRLGREGIAGYEPETVACFLAALERVPDGAVLDIGANIGLYSFLASARSHRPVYGFEPTPDLAEVMRRVAKDNGLGFQTEQLAMGSANGTGTLYLSDRADLSNSLLEGFRDSARHLDVPVETVDHWCGRRGARPRLIKIDTEATEPAVIEGARDVIREFRPWIFCEVLHGRVEEPIMELMRPFGYHWYHLAGDPPYRPRDRIVGDNTYRCLMWLLTPDPVDKEFWARVSAWRVAVDGTAEVKEPGS